MNISLSPLAEWTTRSSSNVGHSSTHGFKKNIRLGTKREEMFKWCALFKKQEEELGSIALSSVEGDCESCFSHSTLSEEKEEEEVSRSSPSNLLEGCPIYREMMKNDLKNVGKVSKKNLWHFSEYFHGKREEKPICPKRDKCEVVQRLSKGGYSDRDLRHSMVLRHPLQREGSTLGITKKTNVNFITFHESMQEIGKIHGGENVGALPYSQNIQTVMKRSLLKELMEEVIKNGYIHDLLCKVPSPPKGIEDIHNLKPVSHKIER